MGTQYDELTLKIINLMDAQAHINLRMRHDLEKYGELRCDYATWYDGVQRKIDEGFKLLKGASE
jgi:hypothetical protein